MPPVDYAQLTGRSTGGLIALVAGLLALFALYSWLLKWNHTPTLPPLAPYSGLIFALTLFFSYPTLAIDLFVYAVRTRIWGLYQLNPLATAPNTVSLADPWVALTAEWNNAASPYGPLWEVISLGAFNLAGGNFLLHLFAVKGIAILSYLGCIFLIGRILEVRGPEWKLVGMFAFAWNPLVLLETAQNAHNDILMVFFLLGAVWALVRAKTTLPSLAVMPLLALATQIKFVPVLVAPLFVIALTLKEITWRRRWGVFTLHSLLFTALVVLPLIPLWPGLENWAVLSLNAGAGRSVMALSVLAWQPLIGNKAAFDLSRLLINGLFLGICFWSWWGKRKKLAQPGTLIYLGWVIFFWYVLVAVPVFHAWYLLWSLPLAVLLLPEEKLLRISIVFSATALLIIPYFETIRVWYPVLLKNHLLGHAIGVPLLVLPPILAAILSRRRITGEAGKSPLV